MLFCSNYAKTYASTTRHGLFRRGYTALLRQLKLLTADAFVFKWKTVWEFFSRIFRRFHSRIEIYSCGQDHLGGYAVPQVKHRRDINLRLSVCF